MVGVEHRPLEDLSMVSLVALALVDAATDRPITEGLVVEASPAPGGWPVRRAFVTPRGLHALSGLPGALGVERADPRWIEPPPSWWVEIRDERGRFLPAALRIDPARRDSGVLVSDALAGAVAGSPPSAPTSPPTSPGAFYLFSAPTRSLDATLAAVRGQLRFEDVSRPDDGSWAGNAVVRVEVAGRRYYSIADDHGRFLVAFPWPSFEPLVGSPPTRVPMERQIWDFELAVFCEPSAITQPPGARLPDVRSVAAQAQAEPWPAAPELGGGPAATITGRLEFGRETVVRTSGRSSVLVRPR
ncbi:hypothetical protein L6R52_24225 [Myxococcota bacterium]|nr:hypothetical protein [Myxococcota bacterium]